METNQKISVGKINSFNAEFNNLEDENRTRDITATAEVYNGKISHIQEGTVRERGSNISVASFRRDLNIDFNRTEYRYEDMEAIENFVTELKSKSFGCTIENLNENI